MYEELIREVRRHGLSDGTRIGRHMGIMDEAADALETQSTQLAAKDAEIERLKVSNTAYDVGYRDGHDSSETSYTEQMDVYEDEIDSLKADLARVTAERDAAINEVCMKCKPSEIVEGLAFYDCDGCKWRTPEKQGEEG